MIRHPMLAALLMIGWSAARAGEPKVIVEDASFPEGPHWQDGQLFYVDYGAHRVMRWDGETLNAVWVQDGCGPSAVVARGENFVVTCYDANSLIEITPAGETVQTFDADAQGGTLLGPNDATEDAAGGVYFSASGVWDVAAPIEGRILYLAPDDTVTEVANDIHYANGLALSPDGKTLYASEMAAQRVLRFEVEEGGALGARYLFARLQDLVADPEGIDIYMGPDGLRTDAAGNLYIAQFEGGRVIVASPEAELIRTLDVPAPYVTNLTFGATEEVVFITAATDAWEPPYPGKVFEVENR